VIPEPSRLAFLPGILALGLLPHAVFALLIVPQFTDLARRGDPIVWYPFSVYGLLACRAFLAREGAAESSRRTWGWLTGLFLVCSIGAVFPLVNLAPYIHLVVPRWVYEGAYATYIYVALPVLLLAGRALGWRHRVRRGLLAVITILVLVRLPGPVWWLDAMTPALVAYLWTLLFIPPRTEQVTPLRSDLPLPA
jgi:hypothetical protein